MTSRNWTAGAICDCHKTLIHKEYSNWKLLSPVVNTVDCRNWKEQIDLASHEIGLPQIKDENEVLSFEVSFYDFFEIQF